MLFKKAKNTDEKSKNTHAKYGIMWRFFGVKIQSKFEYRKKNAGTQTKSLA